MKYKLALTEIMGIDINRVKVKFYNYIAVSKYNNRNNVYNSARCQ